MKSFQGILGILFLTQRKTKMGKENGEVGNWSLNACGSN